MPVLPRIGVAFGGGGARGLAHIHVIKELDALGIRPVAISGSSIGAIMGAAMAAGMTGEEIEAHALAVLADRGEAVARLWRARPASIGAMMETGLRLSQFNVESILKAFLPDGIPAHFEELEIPLTVTATDYFGHKLCLFTGGDLRNAVAASAAIPAVFRPVKRDGMTLIDGGIYNPLPFDIFGDAVDMVIAIDVVGGPEETGRNPSSIDFMFGATQLMMQSIIATRQKAHPPSIMIRPPVSRFRVLDFLKIRQVLHVTEPVRIQLREALVKKLPQLAGRAAALQEPEVPPAAEPA
ncbi:MAG: patatin-like phospholipase family protein [Zhengella sp.]|uniref:patatin-like phospholipase family protein n=1 Tax=Zhengella sp. TaxID=2282762 RepID=UPI001DBAE896|nr:patatin-like phospholipase family protein [Notoacmeibacter sp.]MCC0026520.1 patatin-like phospholipase family protein [Brucellaceae bacterium]